MLDEELRMGEQIATELSQLVALQRRSDGPTTLESANLARRLDEWESRTERVLLDVLGDDPRSRFSYLYSDFYSTLCAPGHRIDDQDVSAFEGVLRLLKHFVQRLSPRSRAAIFDWSQPPDPQGPVPELAEIDAMRWRYHDAIMRAIESELSALVDPLHVASSIGLHAFHAREFFVSLVGMGRLPRNRLTPDWRKLAEEVDEEKSQPVHTSATPTTRLSIFLCHASEDKEFVRELWRFLSGLGHDPWLDEHKLLPGQDWDREIRTALKRADVVLVCLSDKSAKRGYVQKELKRALDIADEFPDGDVFLIPVRLTQCPVPERLAHLQYVDLDSPAGYDRLAKALEMRAAQ